MKRNNVVKMFKQNIFSHPGLTKSPYNLTRPPPKGSSHQSLSEWSSKNKLLIKK